MNPRPLPGAKLAKAINPPITEVALINPSILLVRWCDSLRFLLSRDTIIEPEIITLRGTRLIELPLGWQLGLIRLLGRVFNVCLPDEFEFEEIKALTTLEYSHEFYDDNGIDYVVDPKDLVQLTHEQYRALGEMSGRDLYRWVESWYPPTNGRLRKKQWVRRAGAA